MVCPLCRLINPPEAGVCDCGYNFATATIDQVIRATNAADRDRNKGWFQNTHWPEIYDEKSAKSAKQQGVGAAVLCSAITALFAVLGHLGIIKMNINLGALADAALFAMIATGIYLSWRSAAITGLALYLLERLVTTWSEGGVQQPILAVYFCLAFVNSIRGTFWLASDRKDRRNTLAAATFPLKINCAHYHQSRAPVSPVVRQAALSHVVFSVVTCIISLSPLPFPCRHS